MYAEENSLLFMETSAKTAMNVNDLFLAIGKHSGCGLASFPGLSPRLLLLAVFPAFHTASDKSLADRPGNEARCGQ